MTKRTEPVSVRTLPAQEPNVETGLIKFGEDQPGVFLRGNDASAYGIALRCMLSRSPDVISRAQTASLRHLFDSALRGSDDATLSLSDHEIEALLEAAHRLTAVAAEVSARRNGGTNHRKVELAAEALLQALHDQRNSTPI